MSRRILITGGAGFIGRWLVKACLDAGDTVLAMDNFLNSEAGNIAEFRGHPRFRFLESDIRQAYQVQTAFAEPWDLCYHLAASIIVQESIDDPATTVENDILGTFHVLEACRKARTKMVFMSTCMVYDRATNEEGISETHPVKPASPYAAAKLGAEALTISYFHAYGLPTVVMRPFNTYGPYQKTNGEGGVVAIFLARDLQGKELAIYGEGTQTRDLLYVKDCVEFIRRVADCRALEGRVVNAGTGRDVTINDLAKQCATDPARIRHVKHIHPQSEIMKLKCDARLARQELRWQPAYTLEAGIRETREWLAGALGKASS